MPNYNYNRLTVVEGDYDLENYYTTKYIKPRGDGYYVVLRGGFTYDMGNDKDLIPEIGYWNGGRGCFNEDWDNKHYIYWTEVPKFEDE